MDPREDEYYRSHSKLGFIGNQGQEQLKSASVLVVGAGGLGCPCLLHLATCGIGKIGIADFDKVNVSNLHRQTLYTFDDVGRNKTQAAAERLQKHNPFISIKDHHLLVSIDNVLELVKGYDLVVDCTDNFEVRYILNDACVYTDKPLAYGAIHQTEGHVTVFNYRGSATLRCLFPRADSGAVQSCAEIGAYNVTVSIIGSMMANEVIKALLNHPEIFSDKLVCMDMLTGTIRQVKYNALEGSRGKSIERFSKMKKPSSISPEVYFIDVIETKHTLIDVRYPYEHERHNIGGENLPLDELVATTAFSALSLDDMIVVYCEQGNRSLEAVRHLRSLGYKNAVSLQGGLAGARSYL